MASLDDLSNPAHYLWGLLVPALGWLGRLMLKRIENLERLMEDEVVKKEELESLKEDIEHRHDENRATLERIEEAIAENGQEGRDARERIAADVKSLIGKVGVLEGRSKMR